MKNRIFYFKILRRSFLFIVKKTKKILGLNDSPHSIALGVAIGIAVALSPTIPFHMIQAFFFSWVFRANKTAAVLTVWVSNPFTDVPMFFSEYLTGALLLNDSIIDLEDFSGYVHQVLAFTLTDPVNLWNQITTLLKLTWEDIGKPLLLGSVIWAAILSPICYILTYKIVLKRHIAKQKRILIFKVSSIEPKENT
jgi:uncharacterized protein (DUF2062 family)